MPKPTKAEVEERMRSLPKWQFNLIGQILNAMGNYYCLPNEFETMKDGLANDLISKCKEINESFLREEVEIPSPSAEAYGVFVAQINAVLLDFDPHLELEYNPTFIKEMTDGNKVKKGLHSAQFDFSDGPPKEEVEKWNEYEQANPSTRNYGFIDYQGPSGVIPDNIGYVNISHLIDPQLGASESEEKYRMGPNAIKRLHAVMEGLQEKEGIILDLSVTPYGGSPEMVQNIVSFFMPDGTPINTVHDRVTGEQKPYAAISTPFKLLDKPVALLVGSSTFSGREETAYDLQQFNTTLKESRFTVIGQTTKGGAHPECSFPLIDVDSGEINDALILRIPYATSINPISGTNWEDGPKQEGRKPGIQPDIEIPEAVSAIEFSVRHLSSLLPQHAEIVKQDTTPSSLGDAREIAERYRMAAQDIRSEALPSAAAIDKEAEEVVKPPSPFQITLKPKSE